MHRLTFLAIIPWVLCRAQAPATDPQHASLEGHVVSITGEPLRKVTLRLQQSVSSPGGGITVRADGRLTPPPPPPAVTAQSDAQGNFVFPNLNPGRYLLIAERAGYLTNYNAAGNDVFTLSAGQRLTGIAVKMTPESAISGRVYDADGVPFPKAHITVSQVVYDQRGKQLFRAGAAQTSLDGSFRIEGLSAGRYYITAEIPQPSSAFAALVGPSTPASSIVPEEGYVTTYYPSATALSNASLVIVTAAVESRGVDIHLVKAQVFHVRGRAVDAATGTVPSNVSVRLIPKESSELLALFSPGLTRGGNFDFSGLSAGDYILQSTPVTSRTADGTTVTSQVGRQMITLGNRDVNDVILRLGPGADVTGKVLLEPGGTPQQQQAGKASMPGANARPIITLTPMEGNLNGSNADVKDDGTFAIHGVAPGVYRVQVGFLAPGPYLKYVRFGSQDITRSTLDLTSGTGATLDVLLSPNVADVRGTLHGSDGAPLAGVTVTLWMVGAAQSASFYPVRNVRTEASGAFTFPSLAPGDYRVAAWELADVGIVQAPEFRAKFEGDAAKVKLSENSHETVEAPLIPRDATDAAAAELR